MKYLDDLYKGEKHIPIRDIKTDSRNIESGDLFVAIKGFNVDHSEFVDDAIKAGCSAVVSDKHLEKSVPCIKVGNLSEELTRLCKEFYNYNNDLELIGITGTDGKTTTATIIHQLLSNFTKNAYLGTNGICYNNIKQKTENTTPSKEYLYKCFSSLRDANCKSVVMETSSEALLHDRVDSFKFKYAIYTNITEDHLNIHKTLENYINSKLKLINYLNKDGVIILNSDDEVLKDIASSHKIYTYGKNSQADFQILDINLDPKTTFKIKYLNKIYELESPYPFEYNIYNLTVGFIVCVLEGYNAEEIIRYIRKLKPISGRSEELNFKTDYHIILDYAHTLNGIKNLIENVKNYHKRVIVVTGSAGGREKEKRSKIGSYLLDNANFVVFTMDDPRYEKVDDIIDDMLKDTNKNNYTRIVDRKEAINYALSHAKKDDYILIIGKGRDNYMALEDKKVPYSDYEVIKSYFD